MSPSIYLGCAIEDDIAEALKEVNQSLRDIEAEGETTLADLSTELTKINATTKSYAEVTIGSTANNKVLWKAKEPGRDGNDIQIGYIYEGPIYANDAITGTLSVTNGDTNVYGAGTLFTTEINAGDQLQITDSSNVLRAYTVWRIYSNTHLILVNTYDGITEAGLNGVITARLREPSSSVNGTTIVLSLGVDVDGAVSTRYNMGATLTKWLANTDVTDLVSGTLVGSGVDTPDIVEYTFLEGGAGTPVKDAEDTSNTIAKQFGYNTYQQLMTAIDIPVVESAEEAAAYLESTDDEIVIINKKLFLVEGTNLVGIRQLYTLLGNDLQQTKDFLTKMNETPNLPHLFITQNVEVNTYEEVCGEIVATPVIQEQYRAYNQSLQSTADLYTNGDISQLNGYIFWIGELGETQTTISSYNKLYVWGYPDLMLTDILAGETPVLDEGDFAGYAQIPVVKVIDDPELFTKFQFTDAEIVELLEKDIDGIAVPDANDPSNKQSKIASIVRDNKEILPNGMRSKVKKSLAAAQAIDLSKTGEDKDLAKEMATRGRGCARQLKNMRTSLESPVSDVLNLATGTISQVPDYLSSNLNTAQEALANLPSPELPDVAKKVEAAFGALSSVVTTATGVFDRLIDGMMSLVKPVLNTLQNILSLADNLVNNNLTQCLLGAASAATGSISTPSLGGGSVSIGGIPIPMSLLGDALKELSAVLDETITTAFEKMISIIEKPLCMITAIMDDILGIDLEGETNPCKEGTDPNNECSPDEVQHTINESEELSAVYDTLPQASLFPTEPETTEISEEIEDFTGDVLKTATTTSQEISRGIKEVMEDITKSVESKVDVLNEFDKAIKELLGEDASELSLKIGTTVTTQESCAPVSVGALTDAITQFI